VKPTTILIFAAASISTTLVAQTERELGSHEHGSANMNIAFDQGAVLIELESPWNNLVGFEHAPNTEQQHALVDDAMASLNQPDQLFSFNGAECVSNDIDLDSSLAEGDHDDHEDGHDDHDDGHDDHDDHEDGHDDHKDEHDDHEDGHDDHKDEHDDHEDGHDDHKDGHDDHDHDDHANEEGVHSSVLATYSFRCDDVAKLSSIDVKFLEIWPGFEDLDVQLIGPGGQGAAELGQEKIRLELSAIK